MTNERDTRVLAIDPIHCGFGFVVLEGPTSLVDWGVTYDRGDKREGSLLRLSLLFNRYAPDLLILEDPTGKGSRRGRRVAKLLDSVEKLAKRNGIRVKRFSKADVKKAFTKDEARTKQEIAEALIKAFPALEPRRPPERRPWTSEAQRMSIFDAAALTLTYFRTRKRRRKAA